jgi:undecaprenyl-diphosphatase
VNAIEAFLLGAVQGLTEFLPVSSKGHLVMTERLLGVHPGSLAFEVVVHVATLAAVLVLLRGRILRVVRERDLAFAGLVLLACVPAGLAGVLFKDRIEGFFHDAQGTAAGLLFIGAVLFGVRFLPPGERDRPTWLAAFLIGVAQAAALLPGVSRSGMTISAALALGLTGAAAAEFSFLVSIPVIAGAGLLVAPEALAEAQAGRAGSFALGFLAAFVFGAVAIRVVFGVLARRRFSDFAYYCWAAGALFLGYLTFA